MIQVQLPDLLQQPPVIWTALSLTVAALLCVYVLGRSDNRRLRLRIQKQEAAAREIENALSVQIKNLSEQLGEVQERASLLVQPTPRFGLNLSKRTQALRMLRRGDHLEQIATALSLPQNEVKLLWKVYRATQC